MPPLPPINDEYPDNDLSDEMEGTEMFSRRTMLEHHLRYNHYPPISVSFADVAEQAIDACEFGDDERKITMPNGVTLHAHEIVEQLHLDSFLLPVVD